MNPSTKQQPAWRTQPHDLAYSRMTCGRRVPPFTHYGILKTPLLITKCRLLVVFGTEVPVVVRWGCLRLPAVPQTQKDKMNTDDYAAYCNTGSFLP